MNFRLKSNIKKTNNTKLIKDAFKLFLIEKDMGRISL